MPSKRPPRSRTAPRRKTRAAQPAPRGKRAPRAKPARKKLAPAAARAPEIFDRLRRAYPNARCALDFETPFQLLIATILSAQCTDKRVNMVTPSLFRRYASPEALAAARLEELEEQIKSTGFFRNKSRSLVGMATALAERHGGTVPSEMEQLVKLPGVGRKTANVILGNAFGRNEGVVVDTHVARLSQRLALTRQSDPVKIEQDLMPLFPQSQWTLLAHLLIEHGRQVCVARSPRCEHCAVSDLCPSSKV
jgi:endonuclease III